MVAVIVLVRGHGSRLGRRARRWSSGPRHAWASGAPPDTCSERPTADGLCTTRCGVRRPVVTASAPPRRFARAPHPASTPHRRLRVLRGRRGVGQVHPGAAARASGCAARATPSAHLRARRHRGRARSCAGSCSSPATGELSHRTEALLYAADKAEHVDTVVQPGARPGRGGDHRPLRRLDARLPGRRPGARRRRGRARSRAGRPATCGRT